MCDFIFNVCISISYLLHLLVPLSNAVDWFAFGADAHVWGLDVESILPLTNYQKNKTPNDVNLVLSEVKSATNYGSGSFNLDHSEHLLHFD